VVVLPGDSPLITGATLQALVEEHESSGAATTLLTAQVADPTGYGRVVRDAAGVRAVVEHKDADEAIRAITEIATSIYAFAATPLRAALGGLTTDNAQGELYLTDVVGAHRAEGLKVEAKVVDDAAETLGINDRAQLADLARKLRDRTNLAHMRAGVAILDPETTWIDADVLLEPDVTIERNTDLKGATVVRRNALIGPDSTLTDCEVGEGASVTRTQATGSVIGPRATVGPFSFLRPGTVLGEGAKVGAYVEVKTSEIGAGSKVPHLSYVGDATIGERSNIGAGTIVANYDGHAKHRTVIGDDVRIGSNNSLVAPVSVGDGAYTAAVTAVTEDVPADSLAVRGSKQRNIEGRGAHSRPAKGEGSA
jgi:bifunctional UDP-N-acetylglucosamine pyrophosphorylase / glucosamine-1-phosphate N-acetyltransferase